MRILSVLACVSVIGCSPGEPVLVTPTAPTEAEVAVAQMSLRQSLRDPASAQFRDVVGYALPDGGRIICGEMNARNGFGGYGGFAPFYVRLQGSTVLRQYFDDATGYGPAFIGCSRAAEGIISISS